MDFGSRPISFLEPKPPPETRQGVQFHSRPNNPFRPSRSAFHPKSLEFLRYVSLISLNSLLAPMARA
jgi:hypothetical protein